MGLDIREDCGEQGEELRVIEARYVNLHETTRREEEHFENYTLVKYRTHLSLSRTEAEQILNYYIFHARQNDVNYYFEKSVEQDWRVSELVPMANDDGHLGKTVVNLFAALHRLRADRGAYHHFVHYHRAVRYFQALLIENKTDWLSTLACVILFAQYDVNTQHGRNLAMHLAAAAKIIQANKSDILPRSLHSRRHALIRITMVYDLQHSLASGEELYLEQELYEEGFRRAVESLPELRKEVSIDALWAETHLLWATCTRLTMEENPEPATIQNVYLQLKRLLCERQGDWFMVDSDSPLHSYCPFGPTLLYRSPGLRLIGVTLYALVLMLSSWFPDEVSELEAFDARNKIMCAHAPLFSSVVKGKKSREDNKFLHQAFPAIVQIMIAASEVDQNEINGQEWISGALRDAKTQGYSLGEFLLMIIRSHSEPGRPWKRIGCRVFIETCRHLRKSGLA